MWPRPNLYTAVSLGLMGWTRYCKSNAGPPPFCSVNILIDRWHGFADHHSDDCEKRSQDDTNVRD